MADMDREMIALFDMDGTLVDLDGQLANDLRRLKGPEEPDIVGNIRDAPEHIRRRADLIKSSSDWWANLPKLQLGWDVMGVTNELGYKTVVLTQGPSRNAAAWMGKKEWIDRELGNDTNITITRDKGLVYGMVLVDDYPEYIKRWLEWRRNGLVIMPASGSNAGFTNKQVVRYDGSNLDEARERLQLRIENSRFLRREAPMRTRQKSTMRT